MTLVAAFVDNVYNPRTEKKFCDIRDEVVTQIDAHSRRTRRDNTLLQDYVVEETTGNNKMNQDEMQKLFYSTLDQVINKIDVHFWHENTKLYAAVSALQPEENNFWNVKMVQLLLVSWTAEVWKEFDVAKTYVAKINGDQKTKPITNKHLDEVCEALMAMPIVHLALKLGVTLGASTAKCENSFSVLKTHARSEAINEARLQSPSCPTSA